MPVMSFKTMYQVRVIQAAFSCSSKVVPYQPLLCTLLPAICTPIIAMTSKERANTNPGWEPVTPLARHSNYRCANRR